MRAFFCTDWLFRVSLKNSCNEKLLKVGVSEVGEIKIRAGKQETHWNGFPENIKNFLRTLSIPASKRPQLLTMYAWRHRRYQKIFFMYFKSFCINKDKWQQWNSNPQPATIGPAKKLPTNVNFVILDKKVSSIKLSIWWHQSNIFCNFRSRRNHKRRPQILIFF